MFRSHTLPVMNAKLLLSIPLLCFSIGCQGGSEPEKTSLFEDDHYVAPHWPSDVHDLHQKMLARLDAAKADTQPSDQNVIELIDLVVWTPELTADSELTEAEWLPFHELSEQLAPRLRKAGLTNDNRTEAIKLCQMIESAAFTIQQRRTPTEEPLEEPLAEPEQ